MLKSSTINNELNKEKSDKEKEDVKVEVLVEVEEENGMCVSENEIMILSDRIAEHCVGYTGAELKMIIKKAIKYYYHDTNERKSNKEIEIKNKSYNEMENLRINNYPNNSLNKLLFKHFEKAILDVKRSVTLNDIQEFEKWEKEKK